MKNCVTARKKALLAVVAFLAVACFCLATCFAITPTVKAGGGTLNVTSVRQTYVETYNSAADGKGMRSNYVITFDNDIFTSYEVGDDVTAYITETTNFMEKVKFNYSTLAAIQASSGETVTLFKAANNALELQVNKPVLWACVEFDGELSLNGKILGETVTYYEVEDWTFSTTAPTEKKVVGVAERAYADSNYSLVLLQFNFQLSDGIRSGYDKILYKNSEETEATGHDSAAGGGDRAGELMYGNTAINLYFTLSRFGNPSNAYYSEITFAAGLGGTDTETTYFCGAGVNHSDWAAKPIWSQKKNAIAVDSITQVTADAYSHYSEYEIKFKNLTDSGLDVYANRAANENLTSDFLQHCMEDKILFNGKSLAEINSNKTVTVTKSSESTLKLRINCCINYAKIEISAGFRNAGYTIASDVTYYQDNMLTPDSNATFTESAREPDFKIFGIYAIASGNYPSSVYFKLVLNKAPGNNSSGNTNLDLTGVLLNGSQLYNGSSLAISPSGETAYGGTQYGVTINNIHGSALPSVITFPQGWSVNERGTLEETYEFISYDNDYNYGQMPLPVWTELEKQQVTYKQGDAVIGTENVTSVTLASPSILSGYTAGKTFIGWKDSDGKLYKAGETIRGLTAATTFTAVELGSFETKGAELRVSGSAGVRFVNTFNTEDLNANGDCFGEFGTLIARVADLNSNGEALDVVTADSTDAKSIIVKIKSSEGGRTLNGNLTEFRGGIYNMNTHNFTAELTACGYIAVNYASGTDYVYTAAIKRTVKTVAQKWIADGDYSEDDEAMKLLNAYVGTVEAE